MAFINKFGLVLSILLLFTIGSIGIGIGLGLVDTNLILTYANDPHHKMVIIQIGVLMWIIGLLIVYTSCIFSHEEKGIAFQNANGEVKITRKAVEDFIVRVCSQEPNIRMVKPRVIIKKKYIKADLVVAITSDVPVAHATSELQVRIKESLEAGVGMVSVKSVSVRVEEVFYTGGRLRGVEYTS
ncbi:alkaline shock response membrane anchor protein AmaP [bacterium]|nr:alkaline shock response membrane anchor protein AmaP [bacterium]MBU1752767.1 alkaline shock response membrane anchor protein AmaP [bacterium]